MKTLLTLLFSLLISVTYSQVSYNLNVTVDSDGNISASNILNSYETGITAHAGGGQGSAYQLTKCVNVIATCASNDDSVILPEGSGNMFVVIYNTSGNYAAVFPQSGGSINGGGTNNSAQVVGGGQKVFWHYGSNNWVKH